MRVIAAATTLMTVFVACMLAMTVPMHWQPRNGCSQLTCRIWDGTPMVYKGHLFGVEAIVHLFRARERAFVQLHGLPCIT